MNARLESLKIGFLADSLSRNGGGLHEIQLALAKQMTDAGHVVSAYGILDENFEKDRERWLPIVPFAASCLRLFNLGYSPGLARKVMSSDVDVFHLHTLWKYSSIIVTNWSKRRRAPYIVTPHGMLEPWAKKHSGIKKRIARLLYEDRMLQRAACIHANTEKELRDIRELGIKNPVAIIPNGVDSHEIMLPRVVSAEPSQPRLMLYLGRLHPKKGLTLLLKAWKKSISHSPLISNAKSLDGVLRTPWRLVIAGWDQNGHEKELKFLCDELRLSWEDSSADQITKGFSGKTNVPQVTFVGPVFGRQKSKLYNIADSFVLPSLSEGLPMTVLEAWANSLPVLMTHSCNLADGLESNAAIVCDATEFGITKGLDDFVKLSLASLTEMGRNGRALVERKYQWRSVADELTKVYFWTLGRGPIPDCIHVT